MVKPWLASAEMSMPLPALADVARAGGIIFRRADADLDLVCGETRRLLLFRIAQVAVVVAAADHAKQRHAAAFLFA